MSIKFSDIATNFSMMPLGVNPGSLIKRKADRVGTIVKNEYSSSNNQEMAYKNFLNKLPEVKSQICDLVENHHIIPAHFPLSINSIFSNFVDELVEHYQNQLEHKDEEMNQQWLTLKCILVKTVDLSWTNNCEEINTLFIQIKTKLESEGALPSDFDKMVSIWKQILNIQFIGNVALAALFEKSAYSNQIAKVTKKREKREIITQFSTADLIQSFFLFVKQMQKDYPWMLSKILEKLVPVEDQNLEKILRGFCVINPSLSSKSVPELARIYVSKIYSLFVYLSLLDVYNYEKLFECLSVIVEHIISGDILFINAEGNMESINDNQKITMFDGSDKITFAVTDEFRVHFDNYQTAACFLQRIRTDMVSISYILEGLLKAHAMWKEYETTKILPPLASALPPLIPSSAFQQNIIDDLLADENSQKEIKCKKKGAPSKNTQGPNNETSGRKTNPGKKEEATHRTKKPPVKPTPSIKRQNQARRNIPLTSSLILPINVSSISLLKDKLIGLYTGNSAASLRQAIWHCESLTNIQDSLPKASTPPECLTLINTVAYCAQKVLEQTYSFCIKKESELFTRTHNLRTYHRQFDPNFKNYPSIVNDLFLANTWCRYFYFQHNNWHSLTTGIATTPLILDYLVETADGHVLSLQELQRFVNSTIENTRNHVEFLLQEHFLQSKKNPHPQQANSPFSALKLKEPFNPALFDDVIQRLKDLLNSSVYPARHPANLGIKQALAALTMLNVNLQKANESKDIHMFSTWVVRSLQQLQESVENVLHLIEYHQDQLMSIQHEIGTLAANVGVEIGPLGDMFQHLSYKTRYPVEIQVDSPAGRLIDDLEALKQYPEIMQGFQLHAVPKMLWAKPSEKATPDHIVQQLNELMILTQEFLISKALPKIEEF